MPAYPMDALAAFTHLTDNIPHWITRVIDLAAHTAAKHAEYTEAYKYATPTKPRRRKNSSVCSTHAANLFPQQKGGFSTQGTTNQDPTARIPVQNQDIRNEKTDGVAPNTIDSLVSACREAIIYYDGHTQQSLENMVRDIGIARNNIRRGRMSQMPPEPGRGGFSDVMLLSIRSARTRNLPGPQQKMSAFDLADKNLEVVHNLCESAAYKFLRSGDCKAELTSVEDKLRILLEMAGAEVKRMKETQEQTPSMLEPKIKGKEGPKVQLPSALPPVINPTKKPQASPNKSATGLIEVEDFESLEIELID